MEVSRSVLSGPVFIAPISAGLRKIAIRDVDRAASLGIYCPRSLQLGKVLIGYLVLTDHVSSRVIERTGFALLSRRRVRHPTLQKA
jgi:hypothetical protein